MIRSLTRRCVALVLMLIASVLAVSVVAAAQKAKKGSSFNEGVSCPMYGQLALRYASPVTPQDLAMPFYPGAKLLRSYRYAAAEKQGNKPAGYLAQAFFATSDAPEKVATFYKVKLGPKVGMDTKQKGEVFLCIDRGSATLTVTVSTHALSAADAKAGKTQIKLSRATKVKTAVKRPSPPATQPRRRRGEGTEI